MPSERDLGDCDIFTISWLVRLVVDSLNNVVLVVPVWYLLGAFLFLDRVGGSTSIGSQGHVRRISSEFFFITDNM